MAVFSLFLAIIILPGNILAFGVPVEFIVLANGDSPLSDQCRAIGPVTVLQKKYGSDVVLSPL